MERKISVIISVDFDVTDQLLIMCSAFVKYLRKNGNTMRHCITYLYNFKQANGSARSVSFMTLSMILVFT